MSFAQAAQALGGCVGLPNSYGFHAAAGSVGNSFGAARRLGLAGPRAHRHGSSGNGGVGIGVHALASWNRRVGGGLTGHGGASAVVASTSRKFINYAAMDMRESTGVDEDEETTTPSNVKILRYNGDAISLHKPPVNGLNNWRRPSDAGKGEGGGGGKELWHETTQKSSPLAERTPSATAPP